LGDTHEERILFSGHRHRDRLPGPHPCRLHGGSRSRGARDRRGQKKIAKAAAGEAPFFEPGLEPLLGYDARIGNRFLAPGLGFGGGCLPKDIRAFSATASALGVGSLISLLNTVDTINLGRRDRVISLAREAVGGELAGKRVAVLGGAFKPNSDDIRDSPSLDACDRLVAEGAIVSVQTR
jgi:UDP-glucose/GDP-mannose dehydrogenase family protein